MNETMPERAPDTGLRYAIAAVSEMLDVPIPTIRSWERRYGFPDPSRTSGKHRRYSLTEISQLRALRDAITRGHAAREAVELVRQHPQGKPARDPLVDDLLRSAMELDPKAVRTVLDRAAQTEGVEHAVVRVAIPAMEEVGERWKAGTCDVGSEHALTDGVRSWFARLLAFEPQSEDATPVVLACGPKELHSVGLDALAVLLARRGRQVLNLGALTPVESLRHAVRTSRATGAVVVAQRAVNRRSTMASIEAAHDLLGERAFFAGAAFGTAASRRDVPGVYLGRDLVDAAQAVDVAVAAEPSTR
jgi:DNA-binding transcriptional MerR regulator